MTGVDGGVVGQVEQTFLDALDEGRITASGEVGATYAAAEECVAGEDPAFDLGIKADAAFSVAWGTDDLQGALPYFDDFSVLQVVVGQFALTIEMHSEHHGMMARTNEIVFHIRMRRHRDTITPLDGRIADDMVDVAVGTDDHQRLQPMAVDKAEELVFFSNIGTASIYDDAFLGVVIIDDVGIFRKGIEDKRIEFEHDYYCLSINHQLGWGNFINYYKIAFGMKYDIPFLVVRDEASSFWMIFSDS